jgi:hypothetical protein
MDTILKNTETLTAASKDVCLEVNARKLSTWAGSLRVVGEEISKYSGSTGGQMG